MAAEVIGFRSARASNGSASLPAIAARVVLGLATNDRVSDTPVAKTFPRVRTIVRIGLVRCVLLVFQAHCDV
jgi:hypothetical protein